MSMRKPLVMILFCLCLLPASVMAGGFDGSKPFIFALTDVIECISGGECQEVAPASVNIPQFLRIDVKKNVITGTLEGGATRTTKIERMEHVNGRLVLQGGEDGKAWSISIHEETGKAVLTASGDDVGFVGFGACLLP